MKKPVLIVALFVALVFVCNTMRAQLKSHSNYLVQIGQTDSLYSNILKEHRRVWVSVPESYKGQSKYPVVYVLDGGMHFQTVNAIINQLGSGSIPEMILVGIENSTSRIRDLTPTHVNQARGSKEWVKGSGGGDKFTDFIAKELMPYIDSKYPTTSYSTLLGHSLGGLLVVNTMMKRPKLFVNYIAIDPSLWWDDATLVSQVEAIIDSESLNGKSLFLSISNPLPPDTEKDINVLKNDRTIETEGLRAALKFSEIVSQADSSALNFSYKYYEYEDHGTIPLISAYDGLRYLFPWYKMSGKFVDTVKDSKSSTSDIINTFSERFNLLSNKFGYKISPDKEFLNNLGYMFMKDSPQKSFAFFSMLIDYYPENANGYDSMADYYESQNDSKNAVKFVSKAYEISKSDYHKKRLEGYKN